MPPRKEVGTLPHPAETDRLREYDDHTYRHPSYARHQCPHTATLQSNTPDYEEYYLTKAAMSPQSGTLGHRAPPSGYQTHRAPSSDYQPIRPDLSEPSSRSESPFYSKVYTGSELQTLERRMQEDQRPIADSNLQDSSRGS